MGASIAAARFAAPIPPIPAPMTARSYRIRVPSTRGFLGYRRDPAAGKAPGSITVFAAVCGAGAVATGAARTCGRQSCRP